jgi:HK97 family phage prohead protease
MPKIPKKIKRRTKSKKKLKLPAIEVRSAKRETRSYKAAGLSVRKAADGSSQLVGTAIVFDSPSQDLGGFTEIVKYEAMQKSLVRNDDVFMLWQHDSSQPLARTKTGTLNLTLTRTGLDFVATMPNSPLGQNAYQAVADGTVDSVSFGFTIAANGDNWLQDSQGNIVRELWDVEVSEISPVTWAAYLAPSVDIRSAPALIRAKLTRSNDDDDSDDFSDIDDDLDCDGADADAPKCDGDDDEESEDERCSYRCMACRSAEQVHLSNLAEDDPAERSKRTVQTSLSEDDLIEEQQRCSYRCAACRSLLSGHFPVPNGVNEDDPTRAANLALLTRRLRA